MPVVKLLGPPTPANCEQAHSPLCRSVHGRPVLRLRCCCAAGPFCGHPTCVVPRGAAISCCCATQKASSARLPPNPCSQAQEPSARLVQSHGHGLGPGLVVYLPRQAARGAGACLASEQCPAWSFRAMYLWMDCLAWQRALWQLGLKACPWSVVSLEGRPATAAAEHVPETLGQAQPALERRLAGPAGALAVHAKQLQPAEPGRHGAEHGGTPCPLSCERAGLRLRCASILHLLLLGGAQTTLVPRNRCNPLYQHSPSGLQTNPTGAQHLFNQLHDLRRRQLAGWRQGLLPRRLWRPPHCEGRQLGARRADRLRLIHIQQLHGSG